MTAADLVARCARIKLDAPVDFADLEAVKNMLHKSFPDIAFDLILTFPCVHVRAWYGASLIARAEIPISDG